MSFYLNRKFVLDALFSRSRKSQLKRNFHTTCSKRNVNVANFLQYTPHYKHSPYIKCRIGNRETVTFFLNGQPAYDDRADFPFPSIRFKEPYQEILAIREKEKGNWKQLTMDDKKKLYRYSFRQTFSEFKAPNNREWMMVVGYALMVCCLGMWMFAWTRYYVYGPLPDSFTPAAKRAQCRRMLEIRNNPISGISSYWDYDRMEWNRRGWGIPRVNPYIFCPDDPE